LQIQFIQAQLLPVFTWSPRLHFGFDIELHPISPATTLLQTFRSLGADSSYGSVEASSTDAWRGSSTRVYAPLEPLRPTADEVTFVTAVVVVFIWSMDLFVTRTYCKDRYVSWMLNI
jgi:hypothetical protein